jgi:zinc finger protein
MMIYTPALGTIHTARILSRSDLNRQLIRAPTCTVRIPEFELTLPPMHGKQGGGYLTTVEGLLRAIVKDLGMGQAERQVENTAAWEAIESLLSGLKAILEQEAKEDEKEHAEGKHEDGKGALQITIILDDPAGNSFIEFIGSMADPQWHLQTYSRTKKDEVELGLASTAEDDPDEAEKEDDVAVFPGHCSNCGHAVETRMKKVVIPYFKVDIGLPHSGSPLMSCSRISSSCRPTVINVDTETMKSNPVQRYLLKGDVSFSK